MAGSYVPSVNYLYTNDVEKYTYQFCCGRALGGQNLGSVLALVIRDDILDNYLPRVNASILKTFEKVTGPTPAHRITAWAMVTRQPAFTFTSPIHNHPDITETFPHVNYKYCDLMLKLPADWIYKENFYAFMIYNCLPQLRQVVYANTGMPLPGKILNFNYSTQSTSLAFFFKATLKKLLRKHSKTLQLLSQAKRISKKFVGRRCHTRVYPFHYRLLQQDARLFSQLTEIIYSSSALQAILDAGRCTQFLKNFQSGQLQTSSYNQDAELLGGLATICYSFKYLSP